MTPALIERAFHELRAFADGSHTIFISMEYIGMCFAVSATQVVCILNAFERLSVRQPRLVDVMSGEVIDADWTQFSFPIPWHYDVLRGLDYLRSAGVAPDKRLAEAVVLVATQQSKDGRWRCGIRILSPLV